MANFFIDVMGGDYAPDEILKGVEKYLTESNDTNSTIHLFATEEVVNKYNPLFNKYRNIKWYIAKGFIGMGDKPVQALQENHNTTIAMALRKATEVENAVVISAGNTGGVVASSVLTLGLIEGVRRPVIACSIPTKKSNTIVLDLGANIEPKISDFLIYAKLGKLYAQKIYGIQNPSVGLLNIGEEKGKGPRIIQEVHNLLQKEEENFAGNIEGNEVFEGSVNVVVCDGFVGNILLKWGEGLVELIKSKIKEKIEALLGAMPSFSSFSKYLDFLKPFDYSEYGGALLMGVNGYCIICHGRSKKETIANAIKKGSEYAQTGILSSIKELFKTLPKYKEG
jgi:phosphate acyltransferase